MNRFRFAPHMRLAVFLLAVLFVGALGGCVDPGDESRNPLVDEDGRRIGQDVRFVKVADGLERPVFVTGPGDGRLYVVEQGGAVWAVSGHKDASGFHMGTVADDPFLDLRGEVSGGFEQGLLGLAFHPDWPDDGRVFVDYTDTSGDSVLSVFHVDGDGGVLPRGSEEVLMRVAQPYANHNGGMLAFGPDRMLYWSLGDGGAGGDPHGNGQDPSTLLGSILRLEVQGDGVGPAPGNPFIDSEGADEIWVYGLRNPWRFSFDGEDLWIGDVGQDRFEEVDHLPAGEQAGANLGWNAFEGSEVFDETARDRLDQDPVSPVATYRLEGERCSVTGGHVYRGSVASLEGIYLFGDFCSGTIWGLGADPGEPTGWQMGKLYDTTFRVSSFGTDEDGELYVTDHRGAVLAMAER